MSPHSAVWWVFGPSLLIVFGASAVQLVRAVRAGTRAAGRVAGYADAPPFDAAARAEVDIARLRDALASLPELRARADAAVAMIRRGPLPPQLVRAIALLHAEYAAFRAFSRR